MRIKFILLLIVLLVFKIYADENEFVRKLPDKNLIKYLTPENFPSMDAVIILKEQSFMINPTSIDYRGVTLKGPQTVLTKVLIVKLFNETAVKRYGSFEFEYAEKFGDDIPNGFSVRARVLKENGDIFVLSQDDVVKLVSRESSDGTPLARKVLFKVPNLVPGDILQIEYQYINVFSTTYSGIFYYNDRDFILYSNLYITLPDNEDFSIVSLPKDRIGEPNVQQASNDFGTGKTYFWSLKNLNAIPDEIYSAPFEDRSMITAFVVNSIAGVGKNKENNWVGLGSQFYKDYIDKGGIDDDNIRQLGFTPGLNQSATIKKIDELYSSMRKFFVLTPVNSLYPNSENISDLFETKKADASDLSLIMYKILKKWGISCNCVMIRDKRDGIYEMSIPTTAWFNRLGIMVNINNEKKLYDFDRCISENYSMPWYLNNVYVLVIDENGSTQQKIEPFTNMKSNYESESHKIHFNSNFELLDSLVLEYKGCFEENLRGALYDAEKNKVEEYFKKIVNNSCLSESDSISINNFLSENKIDINCAGLSSINKQIVDSFIVINLKNLIAQNFKDKIYSAVRKSNIIFDAPFQLNLNWGIVIPDGYVLYSKVENEKINGPGSCSSNIIVSSSANKVNIRCNLLFPDQFMSFKKYKELLQFINNSLIFLGHDIVLKKI